MSKNIKLPDDPDAPIRGCELIALAGNVLTEDGKPDTVRAYPMLEKGYLPATKVGAIWTSTVRRVRTPATENGSYPVPSTDSDE